MKKKSGESPSLKKGKKTDNSTSYNTKKVHNVSKMAGRPATEKSQMVPKSYTDRSRKK
jgi:hypothetical protein